MPLFSRPDATPVPSVHPVRRIMPFLMPSRNGAFVLFLFEYGTIPIFVTIGRLHRAPVVLDDGSVGSREVFTLRYTYDERVEDGFYAARALERLRALLEEPEHLEVDA